MSAHRRFSTSPRVDDIRIEKRTVKEFRLDPTPHLEAALHRHLLFSFLYVLPFQINGLIRSQLSHARLPLCDLCSPCSNIGKTRRGEANNC